MDKGYCRVCQSQSDLFYKDERTFFKCPACSLVFTDQWAEKHEEEAHYKTQWGNAEPEFWKDQVDSLLKIAELYVKDDLRILDFGAGSGALTDELKSRHLDVTPLEPMVHGYLKDQNYPEKFNLILGVEVIEHIPNLWDELKELATVLAPGGVMIFTTLLTSNFIDADNALDEFKNWWYKDDQTHVTFFGNDSIAHMASVLGMHADVIGNQAFVLRS